MVSHICCVNYHHKLLHVYLVVTIFSNFKIIILAKKETYTGVMAMDWQDTYVSVLSLVMRELYIYIYIFTFLLNNHAVILH